MPSIFFDLETTDTSPMGQILNYSFIVVGDGFEIIDELSGLIKVSRLQLPSPGAILANRTNLIEHQRLATDSEKDAAGKIANFITEIARSSGEKVKLIGFNSSKFDNMYLRTLLIRNGVDPYFRNVLNGDLLILCRKLMVTDPAFAALTEPVPGEVRRSCTLEHITTRLEILRGPQTHESRDDVLLTIELAKALKERFGADIRTYQPNEGVDLLSPENVGSVYFFRYPEYDATVSTPFTEVPHTLLTFDARQALWVDLNKFEKGEGKRSILWRQNNEGAVYRAPERPVDANLITLARRATREFKGITTKDFFDTSTCDIEADIYRLDMSCRDALREKIWNNKSDAYARIPSEDMKRIYGRYKLRVYNWGGREDEKVRSLLRDYALYRYGGKAISFRYYKEGEPSEEGFSPYHTTFNQMCADAERLYLAGSREDRALLAALIQFYRESDLVKAAIEEFGPSLPSFQAQAA